MHNLKAIPRIVLTAFLLLVLMPLCADRTLAKTYRAAFDFSGSSLTQGSGSPLDEAILRPGLHGPATAIRRGDDGPPTGYGHSPTPGLLPISLPECGCAENGARPVWLPAVATGFVRIQDKLLFPKHWFW